MRSVRIVTLLIAACAVASLVSCGGSDPGSPVTRALPQVHLQVASPSDSVTTRETSVTVRGSVDPPGAAVSVLGQPAEVVGSRFTSQVDLQPGTNVIDLAATAPQRGPALTAIRVTREMPVKVPDLSGLAPDAARRQVEALGLKYAQTEGGGLFEPILPGQPGVCKQDPSSGSDAMRGTTVKVVVSKQC
jgi:hypothetical protein